MQVERQRRHRHEVEDHDGGDAESHDEVGVYVARNEGGMQGAGGEVERIRVVDSPSAATDVANGFAREARNNLSSWRFEASARSDELRVVYSYKIDSALAAGDVAVDVKLPGDVVISEGSYRPSR